ncbi:MAG: MBOAT family protein [Oscillospiraceae bacterium]|nr:MBOAT family protein [Oscillospiraceae bacterium]
MSFNSFGFLFLFFPIFFILYRLLPQKYCALALCAGGLVFYGLGVRSAPWQLLLLVFMTGFAVLGCALFQRKRMRRKWLLALWTAITAAPLAAVKLSGLIPGKALSLPLGLSFYTFQAIAFLVYAWRGGETSPVGVASGVLMFPKLLSGPLAEPGELQSAAAAPKRNNTRLDAGLEEFILGLACKVIVADHLAGILGQIRVRGVESVSVPLAWLGVLGYALRLYFDFWGYSRMAVGLGKMLGMNLPENFDHPYCSKSVSEFWRRWHITLGRWFRTYVYIPLGGSRNGLGRMLLSTLTVWLLTGVWHGAGWNYVLWGLMMFVLIMGERLLYGEALRKLPVLGHLYLPLMISLSWVFFITDGPAGAAAYFARLFGSGGAGVNTRDWTEVLRACWPYLALGLVGSTPLPARLWKRISGGAAAWALLFCLFWVCMYFTATAAGDPFLYFSF